MNGQEYENGYFRGHTTTADERAGVRAAENDRQEKKNMEAWQGLADKTVQMAEEDARRKLERGVPQRRKALAQENKAASPQRVQQPGKSAPDGGDWSTGAAVLGFIISAAWAGSQVQDTGPIVMAGVLGGVVIGRFYKAIIGIVIVVAVLAAFAGSK